MNYFSNIFLEIIEASKPTSSDNKALDRSFKEREFILDFTNLSYIYLENLF